jgi:hypothetical protein
MILEDTFTCEMMVSKELSEIVFVQNAISYKRQYHCRNAIKIVWLDFSASDLIRKWHDLQ